MLDNEQPEWKQHPPGKVWQGIDNSYLVVYKRPIHMRNHIEHPMDEWKTYIDVEGKTWHINFAALVGYDPTPQSYVYILDLEEE